MPYLVYGFRASGSCIVELALAAIGVDYERREVDIHADAQRDAVYAALNPQRKIPAVRTPEGELLTESVAILLTLAERHPEAGLLPATPVERAQALRWLAFVASEIYPVVEINDYPERFAPHDSDAMRERARALWRERWQVVEAVIGATPYLLDTGPYLTDFYIAVVSRWAQQDEWRPANLPKVEGIAAAIAADPTFVDVWARHFG